MIIHTEDKHSEAVQPGVLRAVLCHGERLMLCEVALSEGTSAAIHKHPHEQITYVVRGTVEFTMGDETVQLTAGESCLVEPGVLHGAKAVSDCLLVDAFSPPREDFLASSSRPL